MERLTAKHGLEAMPESRWINPAYRAQGNEHLPEGTFALALCFSINNDETSDCRLAPGPFEGNGFGFFGCWSLCERMTDRAVAEAFSDFVDIVAFVTHFEHFSRFVGT